MSNVKNPEMWSKVSQCDGFVVEASLDIAFGANVDVDVPLTTDDTVEISVQQVLGIEELVSKILSYLPTSDIKSCNAVSSLWRQEARKLLLKRTRMDFGGKGQDVFKLKTQIESYIQDMGDNCHQAISIHSLGNSYEMKQIFKLGRKYGYNIRKLSMIVGNPEILRAFPHVTMLSVSVGVDFFMDVNIPQDLIMPSVKTLSFMIQPSVDLDSLSAVGFSRSLLTMCPMIEYLNLDGKAQRPVFKVFEKFQLDGLAVLKKLTGLALIGINFLRTPPSTRLLNSLAALKLTTLEIDFRNGMRGKMVLPLRLPNALQQVLATFASTLQHLKLYHIPCRDHGRTVKLPAMSNLESLEITYRVPWARLFRVPSLKFTFDFENDNGIIYENQFAVLKCLSIQHVDDFVVDKSYVPASLELCKMFFPEGILPCHTLTRVDVDCISALQHDNKCKQELHCFCNKEGPVWKMLNRMIAMFPNVEAFQKCEGWLW